MGNCSLSPTVSIRVLGISPEIPLLSMRNMKEIHTCALSNQWLLSEWLVLICLPGTKARSCKIENCWTNRTPYIPKSFGWLLLTFKHFFNVAHAKKHLLHFILIVNEVTQTWKLNILKNECLMPDSQNLLLSTDRWV